MGVDMKVAQVNHKGDPAVSAALKEALHKKAQNDQKIVVIKVGTSSLLRKGYLHLSLLGQLAETCADLHRAGCKVIVVTSGAVGAGCQVLNNAVCPPISRPAANRPPQTFFPVRSAAQCGVMSCFKDP
jgi:UDP-glucose 6-dehydrogenase